MYCGGPETALQVTQPPVGRDAGDLCPHIPLALRQELTRLSPAPRCSQGEERKEKGGTHLDQPRPPNQGMFDPPLRIGASA